MNKLILILTMLFSVVMSANNFTGTWKSTSSTYNKVILFNDGNYNFINFSFNEQKELEEEVINVSESYIKTKVYNPSNGWKVYIEYSVIDEKTLSAKFTGDVTKDVVYYLQQIQNE
tara:strand:+ start:144 stop:491 length:348 start_codon:yes stop_codon:yes gene_type:complete